jgi:hypothetical protein
VSGVDRQAVVANVATITTRIVGPFCFVAVEAQTLQRSEAEEIPVAAMRRVVIGDRRGDDATSRETVCAEGLPAELIEPPSTPAS